MVRLMVDLVYPKQWPVEEAFNWLMFQYADALAPFSGGSSVSVQLPAELNPSSATIIPHYAILHDKAANTLALAACDWDEQSGSVLIPVRTDQNGNPTDEPVAFVVTYRKDPSSDFVRLVFYKDGDTWKYTNAPAEIEITMSDGNKYSIPIGVPFLVAALLILGGATVAGWVIHAIAEKERADAMKKESDTFSKIINYALKTGDIKVILTAMNAMMFGIPVAKYEHINKGDVNKSIWDMIKEYGAGIVAIFGVILALMKLQVIIEVIKGLMDMFRRR